MTANHHEDLDKEEFARCTTKLITFGLTWTIEDIHGACSGGLVTDFPELKSVPFMAPPKQITSSKKQPICFELLFYPKGTNSSKANFVGAFLRMLPIGNFWEDTVPDSVSCKYWLSIVDFKGNNRLCTFEHKVFSRDLLTAGSNEWISRAELLDPANGLLQDSGKLVIHCKVGIFKCENEPNDVAGALEQVQSGPPDKLMVQLLESGENSDVTLVLVDDSGKEFRAHKLLLVSRSRVFADMFKSKMKESETNRVEIVETRVEVFKQALHFIYTGMVSSLDGIAKDLLGFADKFQMDPLKSICEAHLTTSITAESNLLDLFQLATQHDAPKLKAKVVKLMHKDIEAQLHNVDKLVQMARFLNSLAPDQQH